MTSMKFVPAALIVAMVLLVPGTSPAQHSMRWYSFDRSGSRGWLGVEVEDVTGTLKDRKDLAVDAGAYVRSVVDGSPAEEAGIHEGDVIVRFGGERVDNAQDLIEAVRKSKPGAEVKLEVSRKAGSKELTAKLERAPREDEFSFNMPRGFLHRIPAIPRRPFAFHFFTSDELGGLVLESLTKQLGEYFEVPGGRGVLVAEVKRNGEGEKAGFKAGDVITKVNGSSVREVEDVLDEARRSEDSTASIELYRKGKAMTLNLPLESDADESSSLEWPMGGETGFGRFKAEVRDLVREWERKVDELRLSFQREIRSL